jgi:hypothetical protein
VFALFATVFALVAASSVAKAAFFLKIACNKFGVKPSLSVEKLAKESDNNIYLESGPSRQQVSPVNFINTEKFAEVSKIGDNYTHAQYVFNSPASIKIACDYFEKNASAMPLEYRTKYAAAIQMRAGELGMPAQGGLVAKYASDRYSAMIEGHILSRKTLIDGIDPVSHEMFTKLSSLKDQMNPMQFAQMLHGIDKKANLEKYYGAGLTNPYEATFAAEPDPKAGAHYKTANATLTQDEIKTMAQTKYAQIKNYFGQSIADEFKKNPIEIFDSMPNDTKEILTQIATGEIK